jgi:hypothetical protein
LEPVIAQLKQSGVKIQKATNEIINAIASLAPKAIASSDKLVSTPKPQDSDDDVFQLDLSEIITARRDLANCAIASFAPKAIEVSAKQDKVLALTCN